MRLTTKYKTYAFQLSTFVVGASLIVFNQSSTFEWPIGSASASSRYTAILFTDGSDFGTHCRLHWQDDCGNILKTTATDPESLTVEQRLDLENRLQHYLKRRNIMQFRIEARSIGKEAP